MGTSLVATFPGGNFSVHPDVHVLCMYTLQTIMADLEGLDK